MVMLMAYTDDHVPYCGPGIDRYGRRLWMKYDIVYYEDGSVCNLWRERVAVNYRPGGHDEDFSAWTDEQRKAAKERSRLAQNTPQRRES